MERAVRLLFKCFPLSAAIKRKIDNKRPLDPIPNGRRIENNIETLVNNSKNNDSIRFIDGLCVGKFKDINYFLVCSPTDEIEAHVYEHGTWEPHLLDKVHSILFGKKTGVFVDVGANIGAITVPLAKQFPDIRFIAFEPHPYVYERFTRNVSLNGISNVLCINKAVGNRCGTERQFYAQKNDSTNLGLSGFNLNYDVTDHDLIVVESVELDIALSDIDDIVLAIKIDVQGTELDVLKSAMKVIEKDKPIIFLEYESEYIDDCEEDVQREYMTFFEQLGYDLYYNPLSGSFLPRIELRGYFYGDIIAFPRK
ncbi:FkbM family methyltransferase [Mesorhizobium kowhaii]|uniref:FkbM family methyltransferase n=1 Tax=Mesorhizobium kowhaii TaxID=1300272 RepID=UPI0035EA9F12